MFNGLQAVFGKTISFLYILSIHARVHTQNTHTHTHTHARARARIQGVSGKKSIIWEMRVSVIIKYMQNIVKHNSVILLRCILTLLLSTTYFGCSYEPPSV